jgi:Domain of unknown function (DUF4383)
MTLRRFALVYGLAFLLLGVLGFIPGVTSMSDGDPNLVMIGPGHGHLLHLFHVNVLHNAAHLLFGVLGLACAATAPAARSYARLVAVTYALLTIMGLVPAWGTDFTFGLAPLHGNDVWLHAVLAVVAAYFGFIHPRLRAHRDDEPSLATPPARAVS